MGVRLAFVLLEELRGCGSECLSEVVFDFAAIFISGVVLYLSSVSHALVFSLCDFFNVESKGEILDVDATSEFSSDAFVDKSEVDSSKVAVLDAIARDEIASAAAATVFTGAVGVCFVFVLVDAFRGCGSDCLSEVFLDLLAIFKF